MSKVDELAEILKVSSNIVFFGGAGMSTESGIPDFRSANGLYSQKLHQEFSPEQMVSHSFILKYPQYFYSFLFDKIIFPEVKPNAGHKALAELEQKGKLLAVVTQNIDGLHQMAGSETVYELHGSLLRWYCTECGRHFTLDYALKNKHLPHCEDCGGQVRPDVVLYEEALNELVIENAVKAIAKADTLIVGGTSLAVYPAAGLLDYFQGDHLVVINKTSTKADLSADLIIREPIGKVLGMAVNKI